jgi:imidazole glycerol phosphate synthase subunit HisF
MANTTHPPLDTDTLDGDEPSVRRARVVRLRRAGKTFEDIGTELGVSRQRAHQLYWEAMDAVVDREVTARRTEMAEQLDEVVRVASQVMAADHIAHSNGRVVTDAAGNTVLDDGPKLDAGRTITAALARLSKMIGADAATQVAQDVTVNYTVGGGVDVTDLT